MQPQLCYLRKKTRFSLFFCVSIFFPYVVVISFYLDNYVLVTIFILFIFNYYQPSKGTKRKRVVKRGSSRSATTSRRSVKVIAHSFNCRNLKCDFNKKKKTTNFPSIEENSFSIFIFYVLTNLFSPFG